MLSPEILNTIFEASVVTDGYHNLDRLGDFAPPPILALYLSARR